MGAASALAGLTVSASNYADDLITQATFTRQTTDDLQKYAYAARFIDVEVNTLTKSMAKNIKSMDSARKGSAAYADAYEKLGVSVTDANGELRNSNDVIGIVSMRWVLFRTKRSGTRLQCSCSANPRRN